MDKNSYAMAKFGLESKDILNSNQKGCGFYLKYFFVFTSLIQFLIILGLVLFMVYGNAHGATESRLQLMEQRISECHSTTLQLKAQNFNLSGQLKNMTGEKNRYMVLYHSTKTQQEINNSSLLHCRLKLMQAERFVVQCQAVIIELKNCHREISTVNSTCYLDIFKIEKKKTDLQQEFYTFRDHCAKNMSDLELKMQIADSERGNYRLQMIDLRKEKNDLKNQLEKFQESCTTIEKNFKEMLQNLHQTITSIVERALPSDTFSMGLSPLTENQITQLKQRCSALSDQVLYQVDMQVKNIRDQITSTLNENSRLQAIKIRSEEKLRECEEAKTSTGQKHERALEALQARWDEDVRKAIDNEQKLKEDKMKLVQQLEEKNQKLTTVNVQLEQCQKWGNPLNPMQRNPLIPQKPGGNFEQLSQAILNFGKQNNK
ncbi:plasmalemma vesicle-associated protein [Microcaecilia unicolor]|uniref:Plasmalemma vesicle-associated protein n=1 Tax=Microcaecilia unicolor TaxID=1415580 RepID=A0A6P7Z2W7_9AMPH|nr:plasmalemma vesicle-associated protein [Microcaecilia unicolor]